MSIGWPAVSGRDVSWQPSIPADAVPRSVRQRHSGLYRAAVFPRIGTLTPSVGAATAALVDAATTEIARLDAQLGGEIAPFGAVLLRSESASSSQIEHLTSGAKVIAVAALTRVGSTRNAASIVGNVRAMRAALGLAGELDPTSILAMHAALLDQVAGDRRAVAHRSVVDRRRLLRPAALPFCHRSTPMFPASSMTWSSSPAGRTCPSWCSPPSPTRSSRPSTPSLTATGGPGGH